MPWRLTNYIAGASEAVILALVFLVPLVIYTGTANANLIKVTVFNLGMLVLFARWLIQVMHERRIAWVKSSLHLPIVCFLGWNLISTLLSRYAYASFNEFGKLASYGFLYFLVISYFQEKRQINRLLGVAGASAFLTCIYGMLQHMGIDWIEWYPKEPRILSSFGNPTFFAAYLVLLLPVAINFFVAAGSSGNRFVLGLLAGLMYLCLLFTYTRAAWLGLLVALVVNGFLLWGFVGLPRLWLAQATKYAVILALVFAVLTGIAIRRSAWAMGQRFASSFQVKELSNIQRTMTWKGAVGIFRNHPLLGSGLGTFQVYLPQYQSPQFYTTGVTVITDHAHNEFLEVAAETGAIGLGIFLWLAVTCVVVVVKIMRTATEDYWRYLASGLLCGLIAFMIQNLAGVTMRWVFGGMFFWLMLGLTAVAERLSQPTTVEKRAKRNPNKAQEQRQPLRWAVMVYCAVALVTVGGGYLIIRPFASEIHLKRAKLAVGQSRWELADTELTQALKLNRYSLASYYQLGHVHNMTGHFDQALGAYQDLAVLSPDYARIHYNIGAVYTNLGKHAEAAAEYEKAVAQEDSPRNHMALAEAYADIGKSQAALVEATRAVEIAEKGGQYVEESPADMYMRRGKLYYDQEEFGKARQDYQKAATLQLRNKLAHFHLGNCYRKMGKPQEARDEYKAALQIDPNDGRVHTNLGAVYFDLEQLDQATSHYRSALQINPSDAYAHFNLGLAYLKTGETEKARSELRRASQLGGQDAVSIQAQATLERLETGKQ